MALASDATRVHRLKVRGPSLNPAATRLRLASLLAGVDLRPPRMPPAATLILRRVRDPSPGSLRLTTGGGPSRIWERAVRDRLCDYYARAWRPALGEPASDPEAVLFMDNAELLSHLALDIRYGRATSCWWWREFLRGRPAVPQTLTALLVDDAAAVPAAVALLARRGQSEAVVGMLTPEMASAVLRAVERSYVLPDLRAGPVEEKLRPATRGTPAEDQASRLGHPDETDQPVALRPQWEPPGSSEETLAPVHRLLLGIALELARRPEIVRTNTFVRTVRRWWAEPSAPVPKPQPASPAIAVSAQRPRAGDVVSPVVREPEVPGALPNDGPPPIRTTTTPVDESVVQDEAVAGVVALAGSSAVGGPASQIEQQREPSSRVAEPVADADASDPVPPVDAVASYGGPDGLETHLAGAFFLCNVMLYLDLPACFQTDTGLASGVGFWETLELLTRALLPDPPRGCVDDALWDVLASLAGRRPAEPIGSGLRDEHFVLPRAWLEEEPEGPGRLQWCVEDFRVWLWSEHGYVLAVLPVGSERPVETVAACLETLGVAQSQLPDGPSSEAPPFDSLADPLLTSVAPGARSWLSSVLPFLKRRLARALGLDNPDAELAGALQLRPGTIYVTAMHVDVVMPLESVSLPVRLAGLDRDPGWLPQAGRVVKFYFQ